MFIQISLPKYMYSCIYMYIGVDWSDFLNQVELIELFFSWKMQKYFWKTKKKNIVCFELIKWPRNYFIFNLIMKKKNEE